MLPPIAVAKAIAYADSIALMAGGITLIYMCTRTFNFAQASFATWGLYVVYTMTALMGGTPYYYLPFAFLFVGCLGVLVYLLVIGPLMRRGASPTTLMMSTLGVDLVLLSTIKMFADFLTRAYKLYARKIVLEVYDFYLLGVPGITFVSLIIVVALIAVIHWFMVKTKFGTAMRATIENPDLSKILGINPDVVYLVSWFIGGGLAGLGGGIASLTITGDPTIGSRIVVSMFASSIVGGLYSVYGSVLGGLLIGLTEYLGITVLSFQLGGWIITYRPVIPLISMAITLLVYPKGLAGINWGRILLKVRGLGGGSWR
ncbi:MAG: branched-chain amino acid ABC transporter permease [Sulfolobales archaeon]